jgi:SRSO17 transposase
MAKIFEKVVAILAPYLGEVTARASIKMYLKDLKLKADELDPDALEKLASKLKPGLKVFVGSDRATELTDQVRNLGSPQAS